VDLVPAEEREARVRDFLYRYLGADAATTPWFAISAISGEGCDAVVHAVMEHVDRVRPAVTDEEGVVPAETAAEASDMVAADADDAGEPRGGATPRG
jgi:GTP-binding protein